MLFKVIPFMLPTVMTISDVLRLAGMKRPNSRSRVWCNLVLGPPRQDPRRFTVCSHNSNRLLPAITMISARVLVIVDSPTFPTIGWPWVNEVPWAKRPFMATLASSTSTHQTLNGGVSQADYPSRPLTSWFFPQQSLPIESVPTLERLVALDLFGEYFNNDGLIAIIIKAQPHHSRSTLSHLTRPQLVAHVDALIEWWKKANPRKASIIAEEHTTGREGSIRSKTSATKKDDCCCIIS